MPHDRAPRPNPPPPGARPMQASAPVLPDQNPPSQVGTYFLGRYRVVDEIGIGGMASVHLGRMDGPGGFQKWVAIKRIHAHLVEDESFIQMFLDEARVAARISHPNVATVFELGKHDDTYWIAMEYLHGEPLREVMRRTEELGAPMPPEIACRVIADAAEGLHAAHELYGKNGEKLNLVHRDVTPHNLFVCYDGNTKVVDFGIAKFSSRMSSTRAGTLKGKLAYMSPEQVAGEPIDRRTDVFALGVVLWELTTGQRLFRMESDLDTLAKVQECNVPRPSTLVRGYPLDLEKIAMKALAKNKNERYRTARELSRALQSMLMKRGLFIASDEVASYVTSIFADRIQKREAHLRWAAEVTQTISLDALGANVPDLDGSLQTYNSEVQPAPQAARPAVPAAGAPVPRPAAGRRPEPPKPDTLRPPAKLGQTMPLGAGRPPAPVAAAPQLADLDTMEDDGPTIMAPTPTEEEDFDDDDDATIITEAKADPDGRPRPAAGMPPPTYDEMPTRVAMNAAVAVPPRAVPARASDQPVDLPPVVVGPGAPPPAPPGPPGGFMPPGFAPTFNPQDPRMGPPQPPPPAYPGQVPGMGPTISPGATALLRPVRRGIPMWAVGVASGVAALLVLTLVYVLVAPGKTAKTATAPETTATTAGAVVASGNGPFSAARAAFSVAIAATPAPGDSATPSATASTAPPPSATAAEPSATASASAAPTATATVTATAATTVTHTVPTVTHHTVSGTAKGETGYLYVITLPPCDQWYDNGTNMGHCPIVNKPLPVGRHRIRLVANNPHVDKTISVIIIGGKVERRTIPMVQ